MAGEATSWRRGRKVCHRREHQVHPPRSHPQADTQVMILNDTGSMWWRIIQCNSFSPLITPIFPPDMWNPAFLAWLWCCFLWFSPFYFQPRSSQSGGCHGFYRAHDPAHLTHTENRGGPYPVYYGDVGLLLEGAWPSLPAWLEHSSGHNHSQKGLAQPEPLLPETWAGNWGWRSQREGPRLLPGYWWIVGNDSH